MTNSVPSEPEIAEDILMAITRRIGRSNWPAQAELATLGIDSLVLLRIIADLADDPNLEVDPARTVDIHTAADLQEFVFELRQGH